MNDPETTITPTADAVRPLPPKLPESEMPTICICRHCGHGFDSGLDPSVCKTIAFNDEKLECLHNSAASWLVDSKQLGRMVDAINAAMPDFKSPMGSECDHAELALAALIRERNTYTNRHNANRTALLDDCDAINDECDQLRSERDLLANIASNACLKIAGLTLLLEKSRQ